MTISGADASPTPHRFVPTLGLQIAGLAIVLGLLADALFNGAALGINVPLWLGALIGAFVLVARRGGRPIGTLLADSLAASLGLSMMIAWRSEAALQILLLAMSAGLLLLSLVTQDGLRARGVSITLFFASLGFGALSAVRGAFLLARSVASRTWRDRGARRQTQAIGRAALIAVPLVLTFGALFFAADAVFETWIKSSLTIDLTSVAAHLAWLFGGTSAVASILWCGLATEQAVPSGPRLAEERRLRSTETGVVLGSLASLFTVFVVIQVRYLFSGEEHVQTTTGLTYAEYARRGFFELVAVAALLLPVLLAADWARTRSWRSLTTFRVFSALLVFLLIVVIASAFQRLRIYVDVFGLTALRLYLAAILTWLAAVFLWLLWSLLKERREEFVVGAVLTALIALVALVVVNPHGTIAATNLARAEQGRDFDTGYALGLSADATPTLIDGIDLLPEQDACELARSMLERWDDPEHELRSWNWGRRSASRAVESNRERLRSACR